MKRLVIRITPAGRQWRVRGPGLDILSLFDQAATVSRWAAVCRAYAAAGCLVQLVLHGRRRILWERTYPRSSDPRRSRG